MERRAGTLLAQVSRLMRRTFDQRAREIGVTRPQWQVLTVVQRNEGLKQGELAEHLEVEPITAGRMIDRLQDAALVERRSDPADRRAWRLFLTPRGAELVDRLQPLAVETSLAMFEGVTLDERRQLVDTLEKLLANLGRRAPGAMLPPE